MTTYGKVRYQLKTPYRDGTTHVIFEPLDFIARLAALVPKPRVNLTRLDEKHPLLLNRVPLRYAEMMSSDASLFKPMYKGETWGMS